MPQIEQAARFETRDDDNNAAVENVCQAGAAAAKPAIGRRLQRNEDQRAEQWAEQQTGAAQPFRLCKACLRTSAFPGRRWKPLAATA